MGSESKETISPIEAPAEQAGIGAHSNAMTRGLLRRFGGESEDNATRRTAFAMVEGAVSVVVNLLLFGLKLTLGILSGSIALIADAAHTASDSLTSVVVIFSALVARKPPDAEHPYGHGRAESLATIAISVLLAIAGFEFAKQSALRIIDPQPISGGWWLIGVVAATALIKEWLARFALDLGRRSDNQTLVADAWHHRSDALATIVVALGMTATRLGWPIVDGLAGVAVSLLLFKVAYDIAREAVDTLLGRAPRPEDVQAIKQKARSVAAVRGVHDVVVHSYGNTQYIALHVETPDSISAGELHDIAHAVEAAVAPNGHGSVCVHVDPINTDHPSYAAIRSRLGQLVSADPQLTSFHDLRLVGGSDRYNVVFDLVCDAGLDHQQHGELKKRLTEALMQRFPGVAAVVVEIEPAYSY